MFIWTFILQGFRRESFCGNLFQVRPQNDWTIDYATTKVKEIMDIEWREKKTPKNGETN